MMEGVGVDVGVVDERRVGEALRRFCCLVVWSFGLWRDEGEERREEVWCT